MTDNAFPLLALEILLDRLNAAGERVFMDDEARAREMQRAQKAVSDFCG